MTTARGSDLGSFEAGCRKSGFDLVQAFRVDAYNRSVESTLRVPDFGRSAALGLLVGNTRYLWEVFLERVREEPGRLEDEHPLDSYATESITAATAALSAEHWIGWAHKPPPNAVPVQRIAHAAGFAWLSPSHLSVHPVFGPWVAFRAVIVVNQECLLPAPALPADPCTRCPKPCLAELERATGASPTVDQKAVSEHFDLWRRVREVCPEGPEHRYTERQLRYHYTKEKHLLPRAGSR